MCDSVLNIGCSLSPPNANAVEGWIGSGLERSPGEALSQPLVRRQNTIQGKERPMAVYRLTELHLGHATMDREHQQLFRMVLQVDRMINGGFSLDEMKIYILEFITATRLHFDHEEADMRSSNYSGLDIHARAHDALVKQLQALHAAMGQGASAIKPETISFLYAWFYDHIATLDRPLAEFLLARAADPLTIASHAKAAATGTSP